MKLADALGAAGLGADAAEAYLASTHGAAAEEGIEFERRAAHNLLRSGHVDAGVRGLRSVLDQLAIHIPEALRAVIQGTRSRLEAIADRGLDFTERSPKDIPPRQLIEIDACWSACVGLAMVDPLRLAFFLAQGVLLALDAGDAYRVARALALAKAFMSTSGGREYAPYLAVAETLARRTGHPHAIGLVQAAKGTALYHQGYFREALILLDDAEVVFREECAGVSWERASVIIMALWCLWFSGDLGELARRAPLYLREADERGDRFFAAGLRSGVTNVYWLLEDDPLRARRENQAALASWSAEGFQLQHSFYLVAAVNTHLYEGDAVAAYDLVRQRWGPLLSSGMLRLQFVQGPAIRLRARAALAIAEREDDAPRRRRLLHVVERAVAWHRRSTSRDAPGYAALLLAAAESVGNNPEAAAKHLDQANQEFDIAGLNLFGQIARRRAAELQGDADVVAAIIGGWSNWASTTPNPWQGCWLRGFERGRDVGVG